MAEKKSVVNSGKKQQLTGQHTFQKDRYPAHGRSSQSHGSDSMNWREPASSSSPKSFPSPPMFHLSSSQYNKDMPPVQDHIDNVAFLNSRWVAIPSEYKRVGGGTPTR